MKPPLNTEILSDYLFDLLSDSEKKKVEAQLKKCAESRRTLKQLRSKFNQLNMLEPTSNNKAKFPTISLVAIAALIACTFFLPKHTVRTSLASQSSPQSLNSLSTSIHPRIFELEYFSEKIDNFSLLSKLEAPLKETIDLKIPEVRIQYDDENYEIVDLKGYESLNLPSEFLKVHQNNFEQILNFKIKQ